MNGQVLSSVKGWKQLFTCQLIQVSKYQVGTFENFRIKDGQKEMMTCPSSMSLILILPVPQQQDVQELLARGETGIGAVSLCRKRC